MYVCIVNCLLLFFRNQYRWWWYTLILIYQTLQKYQKQNKSHQLNTIHTKPLFESKKDIVPQYISTWSV